MTPSQNDSKDASYFDKLVRDLAQRVTRLYTALNPPRLPQDVESGQVALAACYEQGDAKVIEMYEQPDHRTVCISEEKVQVLWKDADGKMQERLYHSCPASSVPDELMSAGDGYVAAWIWKDSGRIFAASRITSSHQATVTVKQWEKEHTPIDAIRYGVVPVFMHKPIK